MYTGSLPPTSIYGTWLEALEVSSADDGGLFDLSTATEITLLVRDRRTEINELKLTLTNGDINLPSTGIIQWVAEVEVMRTLQAKLYDIIITVEKDDDVVVLVLGNISIVE